jgi:malate dehydrogenase (oxaloacetate-decarboxylating)
LQHSDGRALVATGSPFDPVTYEGRKYVIGQCNNAFVFPGVGLGVLLSEASRVTDSMFLAAARALTEFTITHAASDNCLYPSLRDLRAASRLIAFQVAKTARDEGFGLSMDDQALQAAIEEFSWFPEYPEIDHGSHPHAHHAEPPAGA